jgi:hypothetical protein
MPKQSRSDAVNIVSHRLDGYVTERAIGLATSRGHPLTGKETLMKTMYFRFAAWTVALGLGLILVTGASAQCGLPKKPVKPAAWHPSGKDRLLYVRANDDEEHGASIVGMWHTVFTGQTLNGAPFSGVVDNAVLVFHSDGTEIMNSSRPAQDGNFCLGVWERTGRFRYQVNHIAWQGNDPSNAPSGIGNPQAGAQLLEKIILDPDGDSYTGWFSLQAYDAAGNPTVLFTGTISAKRITVNTRFSDLL